MQNLKTRILKLAINSNLRAIIKQLIFIFDKLTAFIPSKQYQIVILADFDYNTRLLLNELDDMHVKYIKFSLITAPFAAFWARRCQVLYVDNLNIIVTALDLDCSIIQLWHATSAIKEFGLGSKNPEINKQAMAKDLLKHSYVTANSRFMHQQFLKNFGLNDNQVLDLGCVASKPIFLPTDNYKLSQPYIIYVPTFRWDSNGINGSIEFIENFKSNNFTLIYCLHPKVNAKIANKNAIQITNQHIRSYFSHASLIISDYSSLLVDASLVCQNVAMYAYDYDKYAQNPGIIIDKNSFWGYFSQNLEQIYHYIDSNSFIAHDLDFIKEEFFTYDDISSAKRIADFGKSIIK